MECLDPDVLKEFSAFVLKASWVDGGNIRRLQPMIGHLVGLVLEDAGTLFLQDVRIWFCCNMMSVPQEGKLHLHCCESQITYFGLSCSAEIVDRMLLNYTAVY
jgi:hypothetical protein